MKRQQNSRRHRHLSQNDRRVVFCKNVDRSGNFPRCLMDVEVAGIDDNDLESQLVLAHYPRIKGGTGGGGRRID